MKEAGAKDHESREPLNLALSTSYLSLIFLALHVLAVYSLLFSVLAFFVPPDPSSPPSLCTLFCPFFGKILWSFDEEAVGVVDHRAIFFFVFFFFLIWKCWVLLLCLAVVVAVVVGSLFFGWLVGWLLLGSLALEL